MPLAAPVAITLPGTGGLELSARSWVGDGLRPILAVHGLSSNCRTWDGVATRLASAGHPVVALDLRGHGRSPKPDNGYDFPTLVNDLAAAIEHLGWNSPVVAGQSTGGNLAVELAARQPGMVGAVCGVDGGVLDLARRWPEWAACEAALAPPLFAGTAVSAIEGHLRGRHPTWTDEGIEATLANLEVLGDGTVRPWLTRHRHLEILRGLWEQRPMDLVAELDVPLLLILARSTDDWSEAREETVERVRRLGDVRIEWVTGDHDLHVEQPELVARLLMDLAGDLAA